MECFTVYADEVEGRIDPNPYHPVRLSTIKKIKASKFQLLPLREVVEFKKQLVTSKSNDLIYLGLENIESNTAVFIPSEEEKESFGTALKFEKGDILFPKLRPYLNKVYLAEFDGVCSTEFHVLKAIKCNSMYLFCFLNSQLVVNQTSYLMTGNTLPRLQTEEVESLLVPIPPTYLQNKIIEQMKKIREARKSKEAKAQQLLDSLNDYVLDELGIKLPELKDKMFYVVSSDEVQNKRADAYYYQPKFEEVEKTIKKGKFEVKTIGEITEKVTSGATPLSKGDAYTSKEEGIPFIRSGDINEDKNINFDDVLYIKQEIHNKVLSGSKLMRGDVLIAIVGATIGQVSLYDYDKEVNINQAIALVRLKKEVNPEFVKAFMLSTLGQKQLDRIKRPVARANINLDEIRSIKIILPSLAIQNKIAEEVKRRMQKAELLQKEAKEELEKAKQEVERIILGEGVVA